MYSSPLPNSDTPQPLCSSHAAVIFSQTHLGDLSLQPWRADAPWSPWAAVGAGAHSPLPCLAGCLSLMSQWPLLGTSVISPCSLQSFPEHAGCGPEVVAAVEGPVLTLLLLQAACLGLWPESKCSVTALFWPPALLVGCPCAGYHAEETGVLPRYQECAGT